MAAVNVQSTAAKALDLSTTFIFAWLGSWLLLQL